MDPLECPWKEMGIDLVIEATGVYTSTADCMKHIEASSFFFFFLIQIPSTL